MNRIKSDFTFFDNIDCEEKAYILGFIAADGCINFTNYMLKIAISEIDVDILRKIKYQIRSDNKILYEEGRKGIINGKEFISKPVSILQINNKYLINSLKNLGFDNKKTISCKFPDIPEHLYLHFIRGYFDGDGSMSKYTSNDGYTRYSSSICGTESFLLFLKDYLEKEFNIKFNSKLEKRFDTENCCYTLRISGKKNTIHFLNTLYKNSNIYLDRKYNKYLSFI